MNQPGAVDDAIARIAETLQDAGIRHAFGGAIAQNYWGVVRATQDVDVLALIPALRSQEIVDRLTARGFCHRDPDGRERPLTVTDLRESVRDSGLFAVWLGIVKVEIFAPMIPLQDRVLQRAVMMPWKERMIPVTTAEDLIVLKMIFHRAKDLQDIRAMVATSGPRLDRAYVLEQAALVLEDGRVAELRSLLAADSSS